MVKPFRVGGMQPDDPLWTKMGVALYNGLTNSLSDRSDFDQLLDYYNDLYEMNITPVNQPWPNAPSICVPLVATQVEAVVSRMMSAVFVPRLFIVNGNTKEAAQKQHETERFYNAEFRKRGMLQKFGTSLHLTARDGTVIMENVWKKKVTKRKVLVYVNKLDENQAPIPDGKGGFEKEKSVEEMEITEIDAFDPVPVELRDFVIGPAWATSIESAQFVGRKLMLTQNDLQEMVNAEDLSQEWVEKAWKYLTWGDNELGSDPQGTATYELGGTINIGDAGTTNPAAGDEGDEGDEGKGELLRGPLRVWRIHSNQYDMDGDGLAEENVFWIHDQSQFLLGWAPYEYWHGRRPFSALCLMPRPNRFYGFGVPERLRSLQEEINAQHNQRLAYMDLILDPPRYMVSGTTFEDQDKRWGKHTLVTVAAKDDYGIVTLPTVPVDSWQEETTISVMAGQLTGTIGPGLPASGSQKMSQKQQQAFMASANIRQDLMALQVRAWIEDILYQWHHLNLQYGPDDFVTSLQNNQGEPEKLIVPKQDLAQDYDLGVAGMAGPLDRDNRRADTLTLYSLLMQNPLVQGNLSRVWSTTMMVLEEFNRPDVPAIIGTMQDALQQAQMQAQAQQKQQKAVMQLARTQHGNNTPAVQQGEAIDTKIKGEELKQKQLETQRAALESNPLAASLAGAVGGEVNPEFRGLYECDYCHRTRRRPSGHPR